MYSRGNTEIKLLLLLHPFQNRGKSPGGYSLKWLKWGCAAGQGMVFVLSVLNRVYKFDRVCAKQGIQFHASLSKTLCLICASLF